MNVMGKIRHIAITAEDPFVTAELFKDALGLEEIGRGDSDLAREVYLTDGYINLAIVCWKRTRENPNPYPEGYGLDHFGVQVEDLDAAEARARGAAAPPPPPPTANPTSRSHSSARVRRTCWSNRTGSPG
jgi:catechol 2,3-dioxygenase-like lactoylglutathione lyase family enzyme